MAWTATTFKAIYTEFANTPDATVTDALASAVAKNDLRVLGDSYDQAVALYAAHLLSIAPGGQQARLQKNSLETTYSAQWKDLARSCAGGGWTIGQRP